MFADLPRVPTECVRPPVQQPNEAECGAEHRLYQTWHCEWERTDLSLLACLSVTPHWSKSNETHGLKAGSYQLGMSSLCLRSYVTHIIQASKWIFKWCLTREGFKRYLDREGTSCHLKPRKKLAIYILENRLSILVLDCKCGWLAQKKPKYWRRKFFMKRDRFSGETPLHNLNIQTYRQRPSLCCWTLVWDFLFLSVLNWQTFSVCLFFCACDTFVHKGILFYESLWWWLCKFHVYMHVRFVTSCHSLVPYVTNHFHAPLSSSSSSSFPPWLYVCSSYPLLQTYISRDPFVISLDCHFL